jgi:hypothetical protein
MITVIVSLIAVFGTVVTSLIAYTSSTPRRAVHEIESALSLYERLPDGPTKLVASNTVHTLVTRQSHSVAVRPLLFQVRCVSIVGIVMAALTGAWGLRIGNSLPDQGPYSVADYVGMAVYAFGLVVAVLITLSCLGVLIDTIAYVGPSDGADSPVPKRHWWQRRRSTSE